MILASDAALPRAHAIAKVNAMSIPLTPPRIGSMIPPIGDSVCNCEG